MDGSGVDPLPDDSTTQERCVIGPTKWVSTCPMRNQHRSAAGVSFPSRQKSQSIIAESPHIVFHILTVECAMRCTPWTRKKARHAQSQFRQTRGKSIMKHTKKKALLLGAAGLLLGATVAYASSVSVEYDTNRYGSDYAGMELPSADPELCRTACAEDPNCRAYTYVKPGIQGSSARCWLKDSVPAATANSCCVSGVKDDTQPPPTTLTVEPGMNRYGSDYKGLDLPAADPELCRTECANDSHCLAYTYVKPGVQGTYAKCWLKNPAPAATPDPNTVSGIKQ
ncbi:hypothetical protein F0U61_00395 [Archangium violaceum]|nr:hypothetical protein F0U61_00395 [Archangium violaceum]